MKATPRLEILYKGTYCLVGREGVDLDVSIPNIVF